MMESNWELLTNKEIIDIIIGNTIIKRDLFHEYKMPYLTVDNIFTLAREFNFDLSNDTSPKVSRWEYMKKLIEYCIKNKRINEFLIELIDLKRFRSVLKDLKPHLIKSEHNNLIWAFIEKINSILLFDNSYLNYNGLKFDIKEISEKIPEETSSMAASEKNYRDVITEFCKDIKNKGMKTKYGMITEIIDTGNAQGGNGKVLFGKLNNHDVAIKVLYNNTSDKRNRFFNEFINVLMSLQKKSNIVELYLYDSIFFEKQEIYFIVMKKYKGNFDKFEKKLDKATIIKLVYDLCNIIKTIHDVNMVHRDIKPENILLGNNNELILSDFGIAYFNPQNYEYTGHTTAKDVLGNRSFSAPEQAEKNAIPHPTMDIYAFGQILQWYITGKTHIGTGRKNVNTIIDGTLGECLDIIIDKCIRQEPSERFQNIDEIIAVLNEYDIRLTNFEEEKDIVNFSNEDYKVEADGLGLGDPIIVI